MSNTTTPDHDRTLRYAIIGGAAGIALTHIEALKHTPQARLVALSDISAERGATRAVENDCAFFTDHNAMLAETKPDVAIICTPHPFHAPLAIDSLRAGVHVLCEKPLAVEVAEGDAMIAAADQAKRILAVNFQQRFRPVIEETKRFISQGELGELVRVLMVTPWFRTAHYYQSAGWRGTWQGEGGGVLMNQAPHNLDLLCHLVGMPSKVWGWTRTRSHAIECEDTGQALLEFANGAPGYLYASTVDIGQEQFQIIGDKAALQISGNSLTVTRYDRSLSDFRANVPEMWAAPATATAERQFEAGGDHTAVHVDLRSAILDGHAARADGRAALMSLELANAIILSSHNERAVSLPVDRVAYSTLLSELRGGQGKGSGVRD